MAADRQRAHSGAPLRRAPSSLASLIAEYKATVTSAVRRLTDTGSVWQPRYHEHVIRSEQALEAIREYVRADPWRWEHDPENPWHRQNEVDGYPFEADS